MTKTITLSEFLHDKDHDIPDEVLEGYFVHADKRVGQYAETSGSCVYHSHEKRKNPYEYK
tara:strand:- start:1437 stop:1616 length:180 start_codon:yes stop_codon:yes gene_type:complete